MLHFITLLLAMMYCFTDDSMSEWISIEKPYTLKCEYNRSRINSLTWQRQDSRSLYRCIELPTCQCDVTEEIFKLYYEANITSNGSVYTSFFTIKSVPLLPYNTTWFCQIDSVNQSLSTTEQYTLSVFAPAMSPTCDTLMSLNGSDIQIHCFTHSVFPTAVCQFYVNYTLAQEIELTKGTISYINQPSSITGYNRTECIYTVSSCLLGYGSHLFSVVMYPNITSNLTEEMKTVGQYKDALLLDNLNLPTIYTIHNGKRHISSNNVLSLDKGESIVMCDHKGHSKVYNNMILKCDLVESYRSRESDVAVLVLNLSTLGDGTKCICNVWGDDTNCPQRSLTVLLNVYHDTIKSDNEFKEATIGLGVTAGFLILILISTSAAVIVWRVKNKSRKNSNTEPKISSDRGEYADIRESPHKYEMPVFKTNKSAQDDTNTTVDGINIHGVVTISHPSFNELITTNNMSKNKHVYSNELVEENILKEEYHQYDEAAMN